MSFTDLGKGSKIIETSAKMYVQWVDAIREVTEELDAPPQGKENSIECSQRCILISNNVYGTSHIHRIFLGYDSTL